MIKLVRPTDVMPKPMTPTQDQLDTVIDEINSVLKQFGLTVKLGKPVTVWHTALVYEELADLITMEALIKGWFVDFTPDFKQSTWRQKGE